MQVSSSESTEGAGNRTVRYITVRPGNEPFIAAFFSVDAQNSYGALIRDWVTCTYDTQTTQPKALLAGKLGPIIQEVVMKELQTPDALHLPPE
jgi:hypothetical protein